MKSQKPFQPFQPIAISANLTILPNNYFSHICYFCYFSHFSHLSQEAILTISVISIILAILTKKQVWPFRPLQSFKPFQLFSRIDTFAIFKTLANKIKKAFFPDNPILAILEVFANLSNLAKQPFQLLWSFQKVSHFSPLCYLGIFSILATLQIFTGNHREFTGKSGYRDFIFTGFFNVCDYLLRIYMDCY